MAEQKTERTTTGVVKAQKGYYWGYVVTVATSAVITVYDNASAAAGTVVCVIPITAAAGAAQMFDTAIPISNGLYANFAGTGTVLFLHD